MKATFYTYFQKFCAVGRLKTFLFYNKVESPFMGDTVIFVIDFFPFSSKQIWRFFLCILPIFDNSGKLKIFLSQNQVEGFFVDRLF